ncbi:MAG: response regulator transcription factor [Desulfatibacillaceae bacterium]|nr:response regulator transcription factor [Desulfatibacillaceae bacterium]
MRIFIAEDDSTSRSILAAVLQKQGHEVTTASDGIQALEVLEGQDAPLMVILDWVMPFISGVELCRIIRAKKTNQPPYIILLSGKNEKADIAEGLSSGADDYLTKPFDPIELSARVEVGQRILNLQAELALKIKQLEQALLEVKTLRGILPICSFCKQIRDDKGAWSQLESYISKHSDAFFSHSICPKCMSEQFPDIKPGKGG